MSKKGAKGGAATPVVPALNLPVGIDGAHWDLLKRDAERQGAVGGVVDDILARVEATVAERIVDAAVQPYAVQKAQEALTCAVEAWHLKCDAGEPLMLTDTTWHPDAEPAPGPIDSWASGCVPVVAPPPTVPAGLSVVGVQAPTPTTERREAREPAETAPRAPEAQTVPAASGTAPTNASPAVPSAPDVSTEARPALARQQPSAQPADPPAPVRVRSAGRPLSSGRPRSARSASRKLPLKPRPPPGESSRLCPALPLSIGQCPGCVGTQSSPNPFMPRPPSVLPPSPREAPACVVCPLSRHLLFDTGSPGTRRGLDGLPVKPTFAGNKQQPLPAIAKT